MENIIIRKTTSDSKTKYTIAIKKGEALTEIKLNKTQYEQFKSTGLFICAETAFLNL